MIVIIHKKEHLICEQIGGEMIVFDTQKGEFYELGDVSYFLWEQLETEKDINALVNKVCDEYEVKWDIAKIDVQRFIQELSDIGLVECEAYETE